LDFGGRPQREAPPPLGARLLCSAQQIFHSCDACFGLYTPNKTIQESYTFQLQVAAVDNIVIDFEKIIYTLTSWNDNP
jgi:hypothetical protein